MAPNRTGSVSQKSEHVCARGISILERDLRPISAYVDRVGVRCSAEKCTMSPGTPPVTLALRHLTGFSIPPLFPRKKCVHRRAGRRRFDSIMSNRIKTGILEEVRCGLVARVYDS